jgi:hypothetical protein
VQSSIVTVINVLALALKPTEMVIPPRHLNPVRGGAD